MTVLHASLALASSAMLGLAVGCLIAAALLRRSTRDWQSIIRQHIVAVREMAEAEHG